MHEGEIEVTVPLVRSWLARHYPSARDAAVRKVTPSGTVNALYRVGEDLVVRIPRLPTWDASLLTEAEWLPRLAPHLSVLTPEPLLVVRDSPEFPTAVGLFRWIDAESFDARRVDDVTLGAQVATFIAELRALDVTGGPVHGREPLAALDDATRRALATLPASVDHARVAAAWTRALEAPPWSGASVWRHGDLIPTNLLVRDRRLHAVIDWGAVGVGDPAHDLIVAWSCLGPRGRDVVRSSLAVDEGTWARARGYALHQAILIIPYYAQSNPTFAAMASRIVAAVLHDPAG